VDPSAVPGMLEAIRARVAEAAIPVANAMARTYGDHLTNVTLRESGAHPPVTPTPAPPGRPPAMITGDLIRSVTRQPAVGGGGIATSSVAPHTIYAATQEYGGDHFAKDGEFMWLWLKYIGASEVAARGWNKTAVHIPARPYMRTATAETVADGSLHRSAETAILPYVPH
jgi:hypothetical protein